jgi:hypothetical protein
MSVPLREVTLISDISWIIGFCETAPANEGSMGVVQDKLKMARDTWIESAYGEDDKE